MSIEFGSKNDKYTRTSKTWCYEAKRKKAKECKFERYQNIFSSDFLMCDFNPKNSKLIFFQQQNLNLDLELKKRSMLCSLWPTSTLLSKRYLCIWLCNGLEMWVTVDATPLKAIYLTFLDIVHKIRDVIGVMRQN